MEVIIAAQNASPRIEEADQLGAQAFLDSYAQQADMSGSARILGLQILNVSTELEF